MTKTFREILPMPFLDEELLCVQKETSEELVVKHVFVNEIIIYRFYKKLEKYLKEKTGIEEIISYRSDDNKGVKTITSRVTINGQEVEIHFCVLKEKVQVSFKDNGSPVMLPEKLNLIKEIIHHTEFFIKNKSTYRLRYMSYPYFYENEIQTIIS